MGKTGFGVTDTGRMREKNEDSIFVAPSDIGRLQNLCIVADGMGGHKAGEIASSTAIACVKKFLESNANLNISDEEAMAGFLAKAAEYANRELFRMAAEDESLSGMGTTLTMCGFMGKKLCFAHVGDSRLYVVRKGELTQLSEDHSLVNSLIKEGAITPEEAWSHPERNVITRALGVENDVIVDRGIFQTEKSDRFFLCSDGLTGELQDEEIFRILGENSDNEAAAYALVVAANANGGGDNISVIII